MIIELNIPEKMEEPLKIVVSKLAESNAKEDLTIEEVLLTVCKQYIAQEYGKYLVKS